MLPFRNPKGAYSLATDTHGQREYLGSWEARKLKAEGLKAWRLGGKEAQSKKVQGGETKLND